MNIKSLVALLALALSASSLPAQTYTINPRGTKYAVVLEYMPEAIKVASLQITFFGPVDAKKEEAFVLMQAEEARKRIPGDVDIVVILLTQPPGQNETRVKFSDGSSYLVYRGGDMKLYSEKTDPHSGKK